MSMNFEQFELWTYMYYKPTQRHFAQPKIWFTDDLPIKKLKLKITKRYQKTPPIKTCPTLDLSIIIKNPRKMRHGKPQNTPSPRIETTYETKQRQRKEAQELAQKH
jgi:hypothetical protein